MGAIRLMLRGELRHRWRSWLATTVLVSIVGGFVLAATAAGRRTDAAFPQFVAAHGFDAIAYASRPMPKIARLPDVASVVAFKSPDNGQPTCNCTHPINPSNFGVLVAQTSGRSSFMLVSGRMPNPSVPNEALVSFTLQQDDGVHLGSLIHVPFFATSQASAYNNTSTALLRPKGPTVGFRVVGFAASESDFPSGRTPSYNLFATQAFARTVVPKTATSYVYLVGLRHGAADLSRFDAASSALRTAGGLGYQNEDTPAAAVEISIQPQALGWSILAALTALVGLAVIGQALSRQSNVESEDYPTLAALGADRRQLVILGTLRNLVVGVAGAIGAVTIAVALSPLAPLGEARTATSSTGFAFTTLVLVVGAIATVAVVLVLGIWPALRATHIHRPDEHPAVSRPSRVAGLIASTGAPPSVVIGVRNAFEPRSGRATVPVGSALLGTILTVIALCGTAVFGASLAHLTATPRLYGDSFQLSFSNGGGSQPNPAVLTALERDKAVTGITEGIAPPEVSINMVAVSSIAGTAIRGPLLLPTVTGHKPNGDGQIGLGATTMRRVGAHVGSVVYVTVSVPSGGRRTVPFRVVGEISFPVLGGGIVSLGTGAAFTISGYEAAVCPSGPNRTACQRAAVATSSGGGVLTSVVAGPKGETAVNHYLDEYNSIASLPIPPTSLVNFGEAVNFPLIFGATLTVFGAATLAHLLVVSVARRRREVGLLKALGFVRYQVASSVVWQSTTLALIGIVVGMPLGIVVGRAVWLAFANNLGVVPASVVPIWLIGVLVAGILVVANLIALAPALVATKSRPGDLLRTE